MDDPARGPEPFEPQRWPPPARAPERAPEWLDRPPVPLPFPLERLPAPLPPGPLWRTLARAFPVTSGIALVTTLAFALQYVVGGELPGLLRPSPALGRLGAVRGDLVFAEGEWWRLLCAVLLHGNLIHLALNGLAFLQLGPIAESRWGSWRTLAAYGLGGLASSLLSATFLRADVVAGSVGASGAVLALAGLILGGQALAEERVRGVLNRAIRRRLLYGVLLTFGLGLAASLKWPIIDNWGHLGGTLCGLALSVAWRRPLAPPRAATRVLGVAVLLAFAASVGASATIGRDTVGQRPLRLAREALRDPSLAAGDALGRVAGVLQWLLAEGRAPQARALAQEAIDRDALAARLAQCDAPGPPFVLAAALLTLEHPDADLAAERTVALAPDEPHALNMLAWALVVGPPARRDPERALALSRRSLELLPDARSDSVARTRAAFLDTQAEALFLLDRAAEALPLQREAVRLGRAVGLEDLEQLEELEERLRKLERAAADR